MIIYRKPWNKNIITQIYKHTLNITILKYIRYLPNQNWIFLACACARTWLKILAVSLLHYISNFKINPLGQFCYYFDKKIIPISQNKLVLSFTQILLRLIHRLLVQRFESQGRCKLQLPVPVLPDFSSALESSMISEN